MIFEACGRRATLNLIDGDDIHALVFPCRASSAAHWAARSCVKGVAVGSVGESNGDPAEVIGLQGLVLRRVCLGEQRRDKSIGILFST
jgi:hypothetical protein